MTAWQAGARHVCAVLPTGGGKTRCFSNIVWSHQGLSCTIAHRQELVGQMSLSLAREGVQHRIIAPRNVIGEIVSDHRYELGRSFYNPTAPAAVAGIDTLISRADQLTSWAAQVTLVTIDECHHVLLENKWGTGVSMFPNARSLGVSASPQRADGKGLGIHADGIYETMVVGPSTRELIDMGYLVDFEIVVPASDLDIESLRVTASGDYSPKQLREAARNSHIVGDVVEQYLKFAPGKKGITFATDVETANEIAASFRDAGVPAQSINAKTPSHVRTDYIRRFRRRELLQLVNVDLFGEGFDVPDVEVISKARPTQSLAVDMQQSGRGLRPSEGKTRALIIDHVSNYKIHGLPDRPRQWTLDRRDKRNGKKRDPEEIPLTVCSNCFKPYERILRACPYCGHVPEPAGGRRTVETVDGDLTLLDAETLATLRAATALEAPGSVAKRVGLATGSDYAARGAATRQMERIEAQRVLSDTIALWAGRERSRGRPDDQSYRRFYLWLGVDVLTALSGTREEMEKLTATINEELAR